MLDLKLPWKKVKVGGPIDFAQWQLSEQVRGMHMAVDKEGDIIAVPVVNVDPTLPKVGAASQPTSMHPWIEYEAVNDNLNHQLRVQPPGSQVVGFSIDMAGPTLAVAQPQTIQFRLGISRGNIIEFNPVIWIPANPQEGQTKVWYMMPPIKLDELTISYVNLGVNLTAGYVIFQMWGLEP